MLASGLLGGLLVVQALLVWAFGQRLKALRRAPDPAARADERVFPPLEVVLCLRGADASLPRLLEALAEQTYTSPWRLQLVVDSDADPAWTLLQPWHERNDVAWIEMRCSTLSQRPKQGSLKCASLHQAFTQLHPSSALVVLLDADIRFAKDGLERCARSCFQPGVGAISGNRWFRPPAPKFGALGWSSWTRAVWNAGAVVLMTLWEIPWGGILCVRREVVEAGDWSELLKRGLCEDTGLLGPLRQLGLKYRFEPSLLMVDPDPAQPMLPLGSWITRQLLTARLHHPAWPLVALHGLGSLLFLVFALFEGDWLAVLIYELGCICMLCWIQHLLQPQEPVRVCAWTVGLLPGQAVDGLATLSALFMRQVSWRGIEYVVRFRPSRVLIRRDRGVEI